MTGTEDKIQVLRQAAKVSNEQSSDKLWCVIAGNVELVNNIAYEAIASKDRVKIIFREHIVLKESLVHKKFDFVMLYGDSSKIRELSYICKEKGGAYIQIAPYYVSDEPNLMLLVAPDDAIKKFVGDVERVRSQFSILLEDQTTGFIETDLKVKMWLPKFVANLITPLFNMSEVVLSTVLISTEKGIDVKNIRKIAKSHKIFVLNFKDIIMEN
ncbi:MAG: hypothetical protein FWH54_05435 [Methanobrevibacter sp.]|nr:hypothetical protein [Methanobrevibacter sp.]